mmetsp:Transcript_4405/g.13339  ORF Transcript_4405/g.13339 Transcript_4405/m.13339 type:complete len:181 (+) Transcript_4405:108-650(+)
MEDAVTAAVSNLAVSEEGPVELPPSGAAHGAPLPDSECLATMEELTEENYVEFQSSPSLRWSACLFSEPVVRRLLAKQFEEYVAGVRKADCAADLRRRIGKGPPIYIEDKHALPLPEGDDCVVRLWFASDGKEYSAKLVGALEGEARQKLWDELKAFLGGEEAEEETEEKGTGKEADAKA